ncbi:MAG: tRNA-intron lyase [Candidatus Aenigmarchaeota archaeon]|nr:tRNA-intron lyase [Candidatus Aenigmarchaeota archaeon]NIQ18016.1 tRNA-intron lyase [Candidatus Aenigmarchaeota archaeon]
MLELKFDPRKGIWAEEAEIVGKLTNDFFGNQKGGKISLLPEEAMYLIMFRNAVVLDKRGKEIDFNSLAKHFIGKEPRLFIRYNAYRDWRDRGLVVRRFNENVQGKHSKKTYKKYPSQKLKPEKLKAKAYWYPDSLFSILDNDKVGKELFDKYWIGQYGVYKQERGKQSKLNFFETIFLAKHFGLEVISNETGKKMKPEGILKEVVKKREYAKQLYEIYEDWRLKGYVVKTGFKFGSHFRIYFPGASPVRGGEWVHSKHVLHVFPKEQKLLISEWSRAVRVAHGVKKTFILGIPELKKKDYIDYQGDFMTYRRKKGKGVWVRETPKDKPRYVLVSVSEDEHIGGVELASMLKKAKDTGLNLLLSITDRETSITYYELKKIVLPKSKYEYYEIEWFKP